MSSESVLMAAADAAAAADECDAAGDNGYCVVLYFTNPAGTLHHLGLEEQGALWPS
jgi:hypothetical protein